MLSHMEYTCDVHVMLNEELFHIQDLTKRPFLRHSLAVIVTKRKCRTLTWLVSVFSSSLRKTLM